VLTSSPVLGSTNITLFNQLVTTQVYSISGGSPSPSYLTYKQLSPKTYSSKGRNVGTNDFKANLINFYFAQSNSRPIVDCNIYTENIINNTLLSNTVVPVLLMDQLLYQSSSFISALSNYLTENSIPCTIVPVLAEIIPFSCIVSVNYIDTSLSTTTIYNNIVTAIQTLIPIGASTIVNGEVYWDITKATPGALGSTLYLSDFYDVITPVIGGNRFTISYHFKGSENIVSVASNQAIGLDFTQVLLGVTPVIVEYTYD
jgi:hypothetical protein